ncbi:MAG: penicillin-insensitive murein endopeptidase [Nitrospirota bacterium]|nr:penicillin-insensitive murein endopeptidase [Nitrospirota bacterium]MDH4360726.1 penicillin-insensitive murein endopeptidase [Nitrospirota bacterium]
MAILSLSGSVGSGTPKTGIPHNDPADVMAVRDRLIELGFDWADDVRTGKEKDFIRIIKLFQCIVQGRSKLDGGDGRIDVGGLTWKWLCAQNAPRWRNIDGESGIGWKVTSDLPFGDKKNSFTTSWMIDRINAAALLYSARAFIGTSDAPPFWIRDTSPAKGGKAMGHASHQTGLDVDMRLPLLPPKTESWDLLKGEAYNKFFHREAALLQVEAIKASMDTKFIF